MDIPAGAKYAVYREKELQGGAGFGADHITESEKGYDATSDFDKFDILSRGSRAAVNGVPKAKLIADIGHDLKNSIKGEIERVKFAVREQQNDFRD